jgi:uncharacterized protein YbjT (DUF2867 family)
MILVSGAGGKTGRAVVKALAAKGLSVRALVHREAQAEALEGFNGVEVIVGDLLSEKSVADATRGVDQAYHICPNVSPDELSIGKRMISAAQASGVSLFVFHSVLHPQVEAMPHHWLKMRVEEALFASDLSYVILQPAAYMQNIIPELSSIKTRGIYSVPYSIDAQFSLVDLSDVAEAATVVLSEEDHAGAVYELAGPERLTPRRIASTFGKLLGAEVRAERIPINTWRTRVSGLGSYQVDTLSKMFAYYDKHGLCGNSRTLERLLGRPTTMFEDFLRRLLDG